MNKNQVVDWLRYVWIIPIVVGFVTFVLTSLFTVYRERKAHYLSKRIFMEYAEYEIEYPINSAEAHGEGIVLVGKNGKKLINHVEKIGYPVTYCFLVIKNITENDAINVKVKTQFSHKEKQVKEEFFLPVWKNSDTLYIPHSVYGGNTIFTTNELLEITYMTSGFERFKYGYTRTAKGKYKENLKKRYFWFIWITKIKYNTGGFYTFLKVKNKENKESEKEAVKEEVKK